MRLVHPALLAGLALAGCVHTAPRFSVPIRFTALGTEPFWAAEVDGARLTYRTPFEQKGRTISVARASGKDFVELSGTLDDRPLRLRITTGPCSDGMSDVVYPFSVERSVGGDIERGCARP